MVDPTYLAFREATLAAGSEWTESGDGLVFVFPKSGTGDYASGTQVHRLAPGDVLVGRSSPHATITASGPTEFSFGWFVARVEYLYPLFDSSEIFLLHNMVEAFRGPKRYAASAPLSAECHRLVAEVPSEVNLGHRGRLLQLVSMILSVEMESVRRGSPVAVTGDEHFFRAFEKLTTDDFIQLTVEELAGRFGCGRRHLNRLFHRHVGLSVAALRMEMRLIKAVALLRYPDAKITNIAAQCGFNHLGLFNTYFKRRFGQSPGRWRKANAGDGAPVDPALLGGAQRSDVDDASGGRSPHAVLARPNHVSVPGRGRMTSSVKRPGRDDYAFAAMPPAESKVRNGSSTSAAAKLVQRKVAKMVSEPIDPVIRKALNR